MRRITAGILGLALALGTVHQAQAQMTIGFKGGVNFATQTGDAIDAVEGLGADVGNRTAFVGGVALTFNPAGFISIQPEALYSGMGYKISAAGEDATVSLNYIQVPVLARINFGPAPGQGLRPYLALGPYVGFKASCDAEGDDCGDAVKSTDFGGVFGGGLELPFGTRGAFTLDGRLNLGLTDVYDNDGDNAKNEAWTLMAGFAIPFGGM